VPSRLGVFGAAAASAPPLFDPLAAAAAGVAAAVTVGVAHCGPEPPRADFQGAIPRTDVDRPERVPPAHPFPSEPSRPTSRSCNGVGQPSASKELELRARDQARASAATRGPTTTARPRIPPWSGIPIAMGGATKHRKAKARLALAPPEIGRHPAGGPVSHGEPGEVDSVTTPIDEEVEAPQRFTRRRLMQTGVVAGGALWAARCGRRPRSSPSPPRRRARSRGAATSASTGATSPTATGATPKACTTTPASWAGPTPTAVASLPTTTRPRRSRPSRGATSSCAVATSPPSSTGGRTTRGPGPRLPRRQRVLLHTRERHDDLQDQSGQRQGDPRGLLPLQRHVPGRSPPSSPAPATTSRVPCQSA